MTVWKYVLPIGDDVNKRAVGINIMMPLESEMLYVKPQYIKGKGWRIVAYARINDTSAPLTLRTFFVLGTGHDGSNMNSTKVFKSLGAADIKNGQKMWHVFYLPFGHVEELPIYGQEEYANAIR